MAVPAEAVKALRERTGAGMMECKKALVETNGDLEAAAEIMRKSGLAKADKKAGRIAAEGVVVVERSADGRQAALVEVNSETDFVAREKDFQGFAADVARAALAAQPASLEVLLGTKLASGKTVEEARRELIARIGENIGVRRFELIQSDAPLATYLHGTRIGVVVALHEVRALGTSELPGEYGAAVNGGSGEPALDAQIRPVPVDQHADRRVVHLGPGRVDDAQAAQVPE
jgi:elongation factor Ts